MLRSDMNRYGSGNAAVSCMKFGKHNIVFTTSHHPYESHLVGLVVIGLTMVIYVRGRGERKGHEFYTIYFCRMGSLSVPVV